LPPLIVVCISASPFFGCAVIVEQAEQERSNTTHSPQDLHLPMFHSVFIR